MKRLLLAIGLSLLIGTSAVWAQGAGTSGTTGSAAIYAQVKQYLKEKNIAGLTSTCTGPDAQEEPNFQQGVVKVVRELCAEEGQPQDTCTYFAVLDELLAALKDTLPPDEFALWQAARDAEYATLPVTTGGLGSGSAFLPIGNAGGGGGGQVETSPTTLQ